MPKPLDPKAVLTTPQACKLLGVSRQTLYLWIERKKIKPWMMVGGASWLFQRADVEKIKSTRYQRENGHKHPLKKIEEIRFS